MSEVMERVVPGVSSGLSRKEPLRVLVACHGHPKLIKGGAENAAYANFERLQEDPAYEAWFLGCSRNPAAQRLGVTFSQPFSDREFIYAATAFDWVKFSNPDPEFPSAFRALLQSLRPDVVHFHHYINFGVEALWHVRETLPQCRIILTLHEYLAICHHLGQMVTRPDRTLCHESGSQQCIRCFPELQPSDFFLRKLYIQRFFEVVDVFVAPSRFLAERYVAWGIPPGKIVVIENAPPARHGEVANRAEPEAGDMLRVGYFGQISTLKGIEVFLEAARLLARDGCRNVSMEIHGDLSLQSAEFQSTFRQQLEQAGSAVVYQGPYDVSRVGKLMQSVDLIVVPSIWWENSPVVIQEALLNGTPVICSDIGGMAEKVRNGIDGFHFPVGNARALAKMLRGLARHRERLSAIRLGMAQRTAASHMQPELIQLYRAPIA